MMMVATLCTAQVFDTTVADKGQAGGFERIREYDPSGNIQRMWMTVWNRTEVERVLYERNHLGDVAVQSESTFTNSGILISERRYLGDNGGTLEHVYTPSGMLIRNCISLYDKAQARYLIFRKEYDGSWQYSALVDGTPPQPLKITEYDFKKAEQVFSDHLAGDFSSVWNSPSGSPLIVTYQGTDICNTKPFVVSSPWEVQWDAKGNFFSIYLYSEDGTLINVLGNQNSPGEGSSYFPKSGKYYFSISSLGDWSVKVVKAN